MFLKIPVLFIFGFVFVFVVLFGFSTGDNNNNNNKNNKNNNNSLVRSITIVNQSGRPIELYWIDPSTDDRIPMTDIPLENKVLHAIETYVGHQFEILGQPKQNQQRGTNVLGDEAATSNLSTNNDNSKRRKCIELPKNYCQGVKFEILNNSPKFVVIDTDFDIRWVDESREESATLDTMMLKTSDTLLQLCREKFEQEVLQVKNEYNTTDTSTSIIETVLDCYERALAAIVEDRNEEIEFQASIRTSIASILENHTCVDHTLNSTDDVRVETWMHLLGNESHHHTYTVHVKHDRKASKIHVIDNFIREDECTMMEQLAQPILDDAVVADGKGGQKLSEHRKAKQAAIDVPWDEYIHDNPVARVSRRVLDYANHVLDLNLTEYGQESLMSIQYFGRGINDTEPDRYSPHCDGDCTGLPHVFGSRMATMVMYCTVPKSGGHTNFRNAGVHVKPKQYTAVFFSYIDPIERIMDNGFTQHSGCPVYEGEKKIVTQWIRLGVDTENPWNSFNSLGIKLSELDPDDIEIPM